MAFGLESATSVVTRLPTKHDAGTLIRSAEGIADRDDGERLWLASHAEDTALRYTLPASIDLRPLVGCRLRVTLLREPSPCGTVGQVLTLTGEAGRVWLLARHGGPETVVHNVEGTEVRAAKWIT